MVLDLYFVAKSSSANEKLSYWFEEDKEDCIEDTLSYNLEKFKFKNNNDHIAQDLSRELTYLLKETDYVKELFSLFNGSKLDVVLVDNFHHLFIYDDESQVLKIDSRIDVKLAPLYLYAVYFSVARTKLSANEIYKTMYDFLLAFDFRALKASYDFLTHDANTSKTFDPGSYFLSYFEEIYKECKNDQAGQSYRGKLSVTRSGRQCQLWVGQHPHQHQMHAGGFPEADLFAAVNYCRNPDGENEGPWCYTTDPDMRWEYCDVPIC